jgi:predicted MFS family arabinose efflux permease
LSLLLPDNFHFGITKVGYLFAFCGIVGASTQGGIGKLIKKFGDQRLIWMSLIGVAASLAILPFVSGLAWLLIALGVFAACSNINRAPTMGQISINSPSNEQGVTMGVAQSASTLARCVGPLVATKLYFIRTPLPYILAAAVAILAAAIAAQFLHKPKTPFVSADAQKAV